MRKSTTALWLFILSATALARPELTVQPSSAPGTLDIRWSRSGPQAVFLTCISDHPSGPGDQDIPRVQEAGYTLENVLVVQGNHLSQAGLMPGASYSVWVYPMRGKVYQTPPAGPRYATPNGTTPSHWKEILDRHHFNAYQLWSAQKRARAAPVAGPRFAKPVATPQAPLPEINLQLRDQLSKPSILQVGHIQLATVDYEKYQRARDQAWKQLQDDHGPYSPPDSVQVRRNDGTLAQIPYKPAFDKWRAGRNGEQLLAEWEEVQARSCGVPVHALRESIWSCDDKFHSDATTRYQRYNQLAVDFQAKFGVTPAEAERALELGYAKAQQDYIQKTGARLGIDDPKLFNYGPKGGDWGIAGRAKGTDKPIYWRQGQFYSTVQSVPGINTKCLPGEARISTPGGPRRVSELRLGDLVLSEGKAVPIIRLCRIPVSRHELVDVTLWDGSQVQASPLHPTLDGHLMQDLKAGDRLDGRVIVLVRRVPSREPFTYDILPGSVSGSYQVNGVTLGSTLMR